MIQAVLNTISEVFINIDAVEMTGVMDEQTVDTIKKFQKAASLPETGDVNFITWNILARMYNIYIHEVFILDDGITLPSANNVG